MKNRSSLFIISVLVALSGISIYLYKTRHSTSTLNEEARNFAVQDTSSITKIFMVDKSGKNVTLEKSKSGWLVNGKYPARPDGISLLLYTIKMIDVKSPVANSAKKNVIKLMTARSTKIEIYSGSELIKQYYVGHENQDNDGTYMILTNLDDNKNYDEPFLTHIPGFNGFLSVRYFVDEADWRDRLVINYIPPQISSIKMQLFEHPDSSFVIKLNSTTNFELKKMNGEVLPYDEGKMKQYLAYFQNINYEKLLTTIKVRLVDSVLTAQPYVKMSITNTRGEEKEFNFVHKYSTFELNQKYGVDYKYDPDRLYMRFDKDKEVALIQYYVFGKILQNYSYFFPKPPVKK